VKITRAKLRNLIREQLDIIDLKRAPSKRGTVASVGYSFHGGQELTIYFDVAYTLGEAASDWLRNLPKNVQYEYIQEMDLVDKGLIEEFDDIYSESGLYRDKYNLNQEQAYNTYQTEVTERLMYYAKMMGAEAGLDDSPDSRIHKIEKFAPKLASEKEMLKGLRAAMEKPLTRKSLPGSIDVE